MNFLKYALVVSMLTSMQACAQPAAPAKPAPAAKPAAKPAVAQGNEPAIRAALGKVAPGVKISAINPSPIAGFKEVVVDGRVMYVSTDGKYLLQGSLINLSTRTNLTEASEAVLRRALLDAVPDSRKISFAPANPKHRVTVFTDIDCGFCRKMHNQVNEYNKLGIAIDYLFFPRAGIGSESFQKAVNVWCAPDRKVALTMAKNDRSLPKKNCTNYVTMDYKLGMQVGVEGTPAVYTASGMSIGGYLSPQDMLKALQADNK
ncbi:MAG: thioredoxin fold domain-containing protein [Arenimonas sp.]|nr:thioredoxin fold domain-containing protein [Arenimonas sp.]